ncbi:hypothetical protein [Aequitasia blattaphilus]|uniref:ABC transporter permease n=1 Tax=Aequitasia blattaphilus TaxID=2949332 RepID=A0ABT1EB05_9FIRM|nr:hypothetical protein [Aequitasia blattaphilus]MCP1102993.1 hypothetical protein [Aequitasia blattaphilus]MCR8615633.1 hypothetical protein [Aequitasia blattaphilus]
MKKMVTPRYLIIGFVSILVGVLGGMIIPSISMNVFHHSLGGWTNLFYALVLIGLYHIMVYSVACHRRGRGPQKYYNNLISYGMLKFQGASIVKNMMVITLLLAAGLFAVFYTPVNLLGAGDTLNKYEAEYSYHYLMDADEISQEDAKKLAKENNVTITDYREGELIKVTGSGTEREDFDEDNNLIEEYYKDFIEYECISAGSYEALTGEKLVVEEGSYYLIHTPDATENLYNRFDNMDYLYCSSEEDYLPMSYKGIAKSRVLTTGYGFDSDARYVINDQDYERLRTGLTPNKIVCQVLFNTEGKSDDEIAFGTKLYKEFALRMSEEMDVMGIYDFNSIKRKGDNPEDYKAVYNPDNSAMDVDWKYEPVLISLMQGNLALRFAIFYLLFLYVAVICLAAVGIISYTRSQSVGITNQQVFMDIRKLGADNQYLKKLLGKMIRKVYVLPTIVGITIMTLFQFLIFYMNDRIITTGEVRQIPLFIGIAVMIALYQMIIYRLSMKTVSRMMGLQ